MLWIALETNDRKAGDRPEKTHLIREQAISAKPTQANKPLDIQNTVLSIPRRASK